MVQLATLWEPANSWKLLAATLLVGMNVDTRRLLMRVLYFADDTKTIQITSQTMNIKSIRPHDFNSSISLAVSFIKSLGLVIISRDLK